MNSSHNPSDVDEEVRLLHCLRDTPAIFDLIKSLSYAELRSQKRLRGQFDQELVRAALSVHEARQRAAGLLPHHDRLWLTRTGLEQSTAWQVAAHKARRFAAANQVYDLCCGIGVDAVAISQQSSVIAMDLSQAMTLRAKWNAEVWTTKKPLETLTGDVTQPDWMGKIVHADPDRRDGRDRPTKRLELYCPPLSWMQALTTTAAGGAIKVSPASNFLQKFPGAEIELISLSGECREATIWFGSLAGASSFRATVLPSGESIDADPLSAWTVVAEAPDAYLFDPDPAIVRSGLVDVVAERFGLQRLHSEEEYLTSSQIPETHFVTAFRVHAVLPNQMREVKNYFRAAPAREYEIKCRHIPVNADAVRRQLPDGDGDPRVVVFCRHAGRSLAIICERIFRNVTC